VSYETEEQQVEALKEWWKENGTPLIVGAVLGLAGFAGWKYWDQQQIAYQESASDLYNQVSLVLKSDDKSGLAEKAQAVKSSYPDSSYAILSAFQLAKIAVENKDLEKAASELAWIIDNHADNEITPMAKIRLARVLIAQEKPTDALKLVSIPEDSGYYALASLVKGNALMALNKKDEALLAFKAASSNLAIASRHPSLQFQIDELSATSNFILKSETSVDATTDETVTNETETEVKQETQKEQNLEGSI